MRIAALIGLSLLTVACVGKQPKTSSNTLERAGEKVEKNLQALELARIDREIRILKSADLKAVDEPQSRPMPGLISEETLYIEALRAYKTEDLQGLRFFQVEMRKRFPRSHLSDNALFLVGKLLHKKGHLAKAIFYFQDLIDNHPRSNKVAAALLHKGIVYRDLNLLDLARRSFLRIRKEYRGSPEFFQVEMELKLLDVKEKA